MTTSVHQPGISSCNLKGFKQPQKLSLCKQKNNRKLVLKATKQNRFKGMKEKPQRGSHFKNLCNNQTLLSCRRVKLFLNQTEH